MTRKQAVSQAIDILSDDDKNNEMVYVLRQILDELPLTGWTKESIIDSIESYANNHNNTLPKISELTRENKLPSNTVIKSKFGIKSVDAFYKKYFPYLQPQNKSSSPYRSEIDNYFLNIFKDNYTRIKNERKVKCVSTKAYNQYKANNTPHISTIIKRCNCKSYNDLLILCGYKNSREQLKSSLRVSYNDNEERISELNNLQKL